MLRNSYEDPVKGQQSRYSRQTQARPIILERCAGEEEVPSCKRGREIKCGGIEQIKILSQKKCATPYTTRQHETLTLNDCFESW